MVETIKSTTPSNPVMSGNASTPQIEFIEMGEELLQRQTTSHADTSINFS